MSRVSLSVLVLALLLFASCAPYNIAHHRVKRAEYGDPQSEHHVLIAAQGSQFKDALVKGVVERLVERGAHVRVVDVRRLPDSISEEIDAYFLLYALQIGTEQRQAKEFVEGGLYGDRSVVVRTQGEFSDDWPPTREEVDAVTAASKEEELTPLIARVSESLGTILDR